MVKKLIESMMKAELAGNPGEAAQKLDHWSKVIFKEDYATKNNLLPNATDVTLLEVVQQQSVIINQLVLSNGNMERQMEKQTGKIAALRETVQSQSTSMVTALTTSLMGAIQTVWHGYANNEPPASLANSNVGSDSPSSPPHSRPSLASHPKLDPSTTTDQNPSTPDPILQPPPSLALQQRDSSNGEPLPVLVSAFVSNIQEMMRVAENEGRRDKLVQLVWTDQKGPIAKGVTLKETILTLVSEQKLHTGSKLYDVEPAELKTKNRGFYWAAMELVDQMLTQEQKDLLRLKPSEQEKIENFADVLKIVAYKIEEAAFERMKELDGKTSSKLRKTFTGIGGRYAAYCNEKNIARIKTDHSSATGPPPASNYTISRFFGAVKNALSPRKKS
jgi:hypothetical protein